MAHTTCPNCGKRLRVPDAPEELGIRCPECKGVFRVAPAAPPTPSPTPDGGGVGWVAKASLALSGVAATALLVYLGYVVWGVSTRADRPPDEKAVAVVPKTPEAPAPQPSPKPTASPPVRAALEAAYDEIVGRSVPEPATAEAYHNTGNAYHDLKRYAEAIAAYKKAIPLKPDFAGAYYNMANAYAGMKRYAEAVAAHKQTIALKPDFAGAYCNMGVAYANMKRNGEAIAALRKAVRLDPDGETGRLAKRWLRTVK